MDWNAAHAGFVIASYAMSLAFILGLLAYVFMRDRRNKKTLTEFEKPES
jgi:heme exporter protein CcmD